MNFNDEIDTKECRIEVKSDISTSFSFLALQNEK
jgi:hypothetical protein